VGHLTHSSILVPYHGWRVSHRTHHGNHGHVENDESWHPVSKKYYDKMDGLGKAGRLSLPWAMFAYPFYLWKRSPGKEGSHYDPECDLFVPAEKPLVGGTLASCCCCCCCCCCGPCCGQQWSGMQGLTGGLAFLGNAAAHACTP
jgi:fatty acid desaturase